MNKVTVKIEGMMCGMCEAHICDEIRRNFGVKKVSASHKKGEATILTERPIDETALRTAIDRTGYKTLSISVEPYVKKGLFGR